MKTNSYKWIIGIIPLIVFFLALLMKKATGPYWLGLNLDPSYVYLFDSFRILDGKVPMIVEHPGTTLQLFGALILRGLNLFSTNQEILVDIIKRPEFYLSVMNFILLLLFMLTTGIIGFYAYKKTKDVFFSCIIQSSSLQYLTVKSFVHSGEVLPVIANFYPETFLIIINNLYLLCLLKLFFEPPRKSFSFFLIIFGCVCALGIITKMTFAPLVLLPFFLLSGFEKKALFSLSLIVCMGILTLPISSRYAKMVEWIGSLFTHTGIYGTGNSGFINVSDILSNFWLLARWNILLFAVILTSSMFVGYFLIFKRSYIDADFKKKKITLFITAILLTALAQIGIVLKHLGPHYLVPALCFSGVLIGFLYLLLKSTKLSKCLFYLWLGIVFIQITYSVVYYDKLNKRNLSLYNFSTEVYCRFKDCLIVPYYRASSKEYALFFGYRQYAPYGKQLKAQYPNAYFHHQGSNKFYDFSKEVSFDELKKQKKCIVLYGNQNAFGRFIRAQKVASLGNLESVQQVISVAADQAIALFYLSQDLAAKGHFKEAILFAIKARALGYPDLKGYLYKLKYLLDNQ